MKKGHRAKILAYFAENPNQIITREKIAEDLGLTPVQVSNSVYNTRMTLHEFEEDIEQISSNVYRYTPGRYAAKQEAVSETSGNLYEEIGRTKNGSILVQDEDGNVYKLVELDI